MLLRAIGGTARSPEDVDWRRAVAVLSQKMDAMLRCLARDGTVLDRRSSQRYRCVARLQFSNSVEGAVVIRIDATSPSMNATASCCECNFACSAHRRNTCDRESGWPEDSEILHLANCRRRRCRSGASIAAFAAFYKRSATLRHGDGAVYTALQAI